MDNKQPKTELKLDFDDLVGELDDFENGIKELKKKIEAFNEQATMDSRGNDRADISDD